MTFGYRLLLLSLTAALVALTPIGSSPAQAQSELPFGDIEGTDEPAVILADELVFDEPQGLVTAVGNVQIFQAGRVLRADSISYNQRTDVVTASGNVALRERTGEFFFAEYAELTGDLADGFVENIAVRLSENARLIANAGFRRGGTETQVERGVFSTCSLCPDDPRAAPLWQLRAREVSHSTISRDVVYRDAWLDFFGTPVIYLPYFRHPDPTVERRSGFLAPTFGATSKLGVFGVADYYIDIAPDQDATVGLGITAERGLFLRGEYRRRFENASLTIDASVNYSKREDPQGGLPDPASLRGHLFADAVLNINEHWRAGLSLRETTDNAYPEVFRITGADVLTSHAYVEGFYGLSYASAEIYRFTDLRNDAAAQPLVAPWLNFNYVGEPGEAILGGQYQFDASFVGLTRSNRLTDQARPTEGVDTYRFSFDGRWRRESISDGGFVTMMEASLGGQVYSAFDLPDPLNPAIRDSSSFAARIVPSAAITTSYPLVRQQDELQFLIEPIAGVRATGVLESGGPIPNNDSPALEFDEINLFSASRYPGVDRVDDGVRLTYGVRAGVYDSAGRSSTLFLGQNYRFGFEQEFNDGSGLEGDFSDIVGRLTINPADWLALDWRFRLDNEDLSPRRSEVGAAIGTPDYSLNAQYTFVDAQAGTRTGEDQEELFLGGQARLAEFWRARASIRRDMENDQFRTISLGLIYEDECFTFGVDYRRQYTADRETTDGESVMFTIALRGIGEPAVGAGDGWRF